MRLDLSSAAISGYLRAPVEVQVEGEVGSTNTRVKSMLLQGKQPPFLLLAESQTAGRGRLGRSFCSPEGAGLYMSLALEATLPPEELLSVTAAAAVAVALAVESLTPLSPKIKWVNDLYIEERKLCGILAEGVIDLSSGRLQGLVIGIGINCSDVAMPPELADTVTSLERAGAVVDRNRLAAAVCDRLWSLYSELPQKSWLSPYRERFWLEGKTVVCRIGHRTVEGVALGIDDFGALLVETPLGVERLFSGEATVRKKSI